MFSFIGSIMAALEPACAIMSPPPLLNVIRENAGRQREMNYPA